MADIIAGTGVSPVKNIARRKAFSRAVYRYAFLGDRAVLSDFRTFTFGTISAAFRFPAERSSRAFVPNALTGVWRGVIRNCTGRQASISVTV